MNRKNESLIEYYKFKKLKLNNSSSDNCFLINEINKIVKASNTHKYKTDIYKGLLFAYINLTDSSKKLGLRYRKN